MRLAHLFVLSALTMSSASAADKPYLSLNQYRSLEAEAVDKALGSPVVTLYLGGVIESAGIINAILEENNKPQIYCLTSGISAEVLRRFLNDYIKNMDAMGPKGRAAMDVINVGAASVFIMKEKFPCKPNNRD